MSGLMETIFGGKSKDGDAGMMMPGMNDPYSQYAQPFDPNMLPLLNAPNTGNAQIAQFTTDNDGVIESFKEGLRGYRRVRKFDVKSKTETVEIEKFGEPAMNDQGINELGRDLEMFLSKPFLLSNFPKEDRGRIDTMMKIIWKTTSTKLIVNSNRYELDKTRRPSIVREMVFIVYMNIMRSFEDGERPRLYGSHKTMQTIQQYGQPQAQPQKKSIFGW